jgi:hypothetical protein
MNATVSNTLAGVQDFLRRSSTALTISVVCIG